MHSEPVNPNDLGNSVFVTYLINMLWGKRSVAQVHIVTSVAPES